MTDEVVQCLMDFYSAEQIEAFRKEAFDALMSRSTVTIHITATGQDGRSAQGMVLSTPAEQALFIRQCRQAAAALRNNGVPILEPEGVSVHFGHRFTHT